MSDLVVILAAIKELSVSLAAITTAYVAVTGLHKWQKELKGKAEFEVARALAKSMYLLRDEIRSCRSPFTDSSEFPADYSATKSNTSEQVGQAWAYVYSKRWEPVAKALQEFDTATLEAEALWGPPIKAKTSELKRCVFSLRIDIEAYVEDKYSGGQNFKDKDFAKKVKRGIWDSSSEDNELTLKINNAINQIEEEIRPHLSRS